MFDVAVAHSNDPQTEDAVNEILEQCTGQLKGQSPQAGIVFASIDHDHEQVLKALNQSFPGIQLIGCTTDGEMSSVLEFQQNSLTLMLFCSDTVIFQAGMGEHISDNPKGIARDAVQDAMMKLSVPPKLCVTLPESLTANSKVILDGIKDGLSEAVPIVGGLAADQWRFEATYQFCNDRVASDAAPFLLMGGDLLMSHGVAGGWHPVGNSGRVDRAEGNVVYEIDGMSALDYYRHYLGARMPSSQYPLAVYEGPKHYYLRAPSGEIDEVEKSVSFFGDVPVGATVQMTEASRDDILMASEASMRSALATYPGKQPGAALFFSCASRRQILGTRTREEYQRVKESMSTVLPSCGFYTNGEIAPLAAGKPSQFHNETFISVVLGTE